MNSDEGFFVDKNPLNCEQNSLVLHKNLKIDTIKARGLILKGVRWRFYMIFSCNKLSKVV